jgi:hypothetical protein
MIGMVSPRISSVKEVIENLKAWRGIWKPEKFDNEGLMVYEDNDDIYITNLIGTKKPEDIQDLQGRISIVSSLKVEDDEKEGLLGVLTELYGEGLKAALESGTGFVIILNGEFSYFGFSNERAGNLKTGLAEEHIMDLMTGMKRATVRANGGYEENYLTWECYYPDREEPFLHRTYALISEEESKLFNTSSLLPIQEKKKAFREDYDVFKERLLSLGVSEKDLNHLDFIITHGVWADLCTRIMGLSCSAAFILITENGSVFFSARVGSPAGSGGCIGIEKVLVLSEEDKNNPLIVGRLEEAELDITAQLDRFNTLAGIEAVGNLDLI